MIFLVLVEIALLCILVLLFRVAIRRGVVRVLKGDDDFGEEIQTARTDTVTNKSAIIIKAFPTREGTQRKAG